MNDRVEPFVAIREVEQSTQASIRRARARAEERVAECRRRAEQRLTVISTMHADESLIERAREEAAAELAALDEEVTRLEAEAVGHHAAVVPQLLDLITGGER